MKLPTAVDIAQARVADMPTDTLFERLAKASAYQMELRKAKDELASGEWIPEDASPTRERGA